MHKHTQCLTILFTIASFLAAYTHESYAARHNIRRSQPTIPLLTAVASSNSNLHIVYRHIDTGSDLNVTDEQGNTALMLAAKHRKPEIVRALTRVSRVNLIAKNKQGEDALTIAARMKNNEEIFHHLVNVISSKHPEKKADGYLGRARQAFIATKAQPLLLVVTKWIAAVGSLATFAGVGALVWYQKQKMSIMKEHVA